MAKKPLSRRDLIKRNVQLVLTIEHKERSITEMYNAYQRDRDDWTAKEARLREQLQLKFVDERTRLLSSLGQLTEALSKAIIYTVGKEQL
jgi:hypothetical protein